MNTQSAQTPITPDDRLFILAHSVDLIQRVVDLPDTELHSLVNMSEFAFQHARLAAVLHNIGDACRHPVHIPEALGQGGTNAHSSDCICLDCCNQTSLWSEAPGQGGNQ